MSLVVDRYLDFLSARPYLPGYVASEMHAHPERIRAVFGQRGPMPVTVLRLEVDGDRFDAFVAERKRSLPEFFLNGLRP